MTEETKDAGLVENGRPANTLVVPLQYPVTHEEKTYDSVTLRRVTVKQMADFIKEMQQGNDAVPPMLDLPLEVYNELDDDDMIEIEEKMRPFTPRRLTAMLASLAGTGVDTQG